MLCSLKPLRLILCSIMLAVSFNCGAQELLMKYLGGAAWEIKSGNTVVLVDPTVTRPKFDDGGIANDKGRYLASFYPEPDVSLIDEVFTRANFIVVTHSHADHILDVPYIAKKTGAVVIGTESSVNILRAYGVDEQQLYAVKGGEDYQFEGISIRVINSLHTHLRFGALGDGRHYFDSRRYTEVPKLPLSYSDFIEGGTLAFLLRFSEGEVLAMGSMNFVERELQGIKPDVLIAGAGQKNIYKHTERLLQATGFPKVVMPTHWVGSNYEDEARVNWARKNVAERFMREVAEASPQSRFFIPEHRRTMAINMKSGSIEYVKP